jgi:hypothetical protein
MKIKTPETFFHGIVGHVRDRHGQRIDRWAQAATLANYWRRYYNMTENTWPYHDYDNSSRTTSLSSQTHRLLGLINFKYLIRLPSFRPCYMAFSFKTRTAMLQS